MPVANPGWLLNWPSTQSKTFNILIFSEVFIRNITTHSIIFQVVYGFGVLCQQILGTMLYTQTENVQNPSKSTNSSGRKRLSTLHLHVFGAIILIDFKKRRGIIFWISKTNCLLHSFQNREKMFLISRIKVNTYIQLRAQVSRD